MGSILADIDALLLGNSRYNRSIAAGKPSRSRGATHPSFAQTFSPEEGAGNAGCALHPRSRVQDAQRKRTRAYRFSGNTPASPTQWLYGLCHALPGDEFVLSPSSAAFATARPGRVRVSHRGLGTSNGCQNHMVLPYATTRLRQTAFVRRRTSAVMEASPG